MEQSYRAKSIMGLLTIEGHEGATLKITATGSDAKEVLDALQEIFDTSLTRSKVHAGTP